MPVLIPPEPDDLNFYFFFHLSEYEQVFVEIFSRFMEKRGMVMFLHFVTGVVLLSTFILFTGHVIFRIFLLIGTKVSNEITVGLCRLFSAVCKPRIMLIVPV